MTNPHLILHKVRGLPAFDIAEQIEVVVEGETELWWIIPTSGHRAYPYQAYCLDELYWAPTCNDPKIPITNATEAMLDKLTNLPDHYACNATPKSPSFTTTLLDKLGLIKPINRRF